VRLVTRRPSFSRPILDKSAALRLYRGLIARAVSLKKRPIHQEAAPVLCALSGFTIELSSF
jgi:hypothetical protein